MSIRSYSSPLALGHKFLEKLWDGPVVVQEKIDGSQFSFGIDSLGNPIAKSKRQNIIIDPNGGGDYGMFGKAIQTVVELWDGGLLQPGWTYRGEYLQKPKHNALAYDRVPDGNIILYDVDMGDQDYMSPQELLGMAWELSLEAVPYFGTLHKQTGMEWLTAQLQQTSILGGQKVEGIVLKNYTQIGSDKKILMAKLVSEEFKEVHKKAWGESNPSQKSFIDLLAQDYRTEARWNKAVIHLQEQGTLLNAPQDIPALMKEVNLDILKECEDEIKERLFKHFWKQMSRNATRGLPEWYKAKLMEGVDD